VDAGKEVVASAVKSADAGVAAVGKALTALKLYTEMSSTHASAEARMVQWRARELVDVEMEQMCSDLMVTTLKTTNEAVKECAKAAMAAAVSACEVSWLLHSAVAQLSSHAKQEEMKAKEAAAEEDEEEEEEMMTEEEKKDKEEEAKRRAEEAAQKAAEEEERKKKQAEEDEELMKNPEKLEKKVQVLMMVKNTILLQESNANALRLQEQVLQLLRSRFNIQMNKQSNPITVPQKQYLFETVADLLDQGCTDFEASLAKTEENSSDMEEDEMQGGESDEPRTPSAASKKRKKTAGEGWEGAFDTAFGWIIEGVESSRLALPSARVQILRMAVVVDVDALCQMAETEFFPRVAQTVYPEAALQGNLGPAWRKECSSLATRCDRVLTGFMNLVGQEDAK